MGVLTPLNARNQSHRLQFCKSPASRPPLLVQRTEELSQRRAKARRILAALTWAEGYEQGISGP